MTREAFDQLVRHVEREFGRRPAALTARVILWALVGYAGLLVVWLTFLAIGAGFFVAMLWVDPAARTACGLLGVAVLIGGTYVSVRALLVPLDPPVGRPLTRAEAPALFAALDELQAQLRAAAFWKVLIVPECNAAVVQQPRLGWLGWPRNYLLLGLPLLEALSAAEVRAVLAHEFTHLSRAHGRIHAWLYRLRRSWELTFHELEQSPAARHGALRPLLRRFVNWFWPRFNAYAFVLSRTQEYEADTHAALLAGREPLAASLLRIRIQGRFLEQRFWPDVWEQTVTRATPPEDVFGQLASALHQGAPAEDRARAQTEALSAITNNADTHPCTSERLQAIGVTPESALAQVQCSPEPTAAQALLGATRQTLRQDLQRRWQEDVEAHWRARHARGRALTDRLSSLDAAALPAGEDVDRLWDRASVLLELHADPEIQPLLRQILQLRPDHAPALFQLGRILLANGQAEGERLLEHLMTTEEDSVPQACALLRQHYSQKGDLEPLRRVEQRLDRHEQELAASQLERREITRQDTLIAHALTDAELAGLRQVLAAEPELAWAALGQKQLKYFRHQRLFLLCVQRRPAWHRFPNAGRDRALVERLTLAIRLPGRFLVITPSGPYRALARKLHRVPGSAVFQRAP